MLNLSEFNIVKKEVNDYFYRITVETKDRPMFCTKCMWDEDQAKLFPEYKGWEFKLHSTTERIVSDISMHGKAVKLIINHKRYKCPLCNKTFYEPLMSVESHDKVTTRLREHIKKESLLRPFTQIATEYDISHTSVKRYFQEFVDEQEKDRVIKAPKILGIDEAHLNKTMRGVFTDTGNRMLLDITPDNLKRTVKNFIQSMDGYKDIEVVTMDMWSGYKYAVNELIPEAWVVIDKFHVIQYTIRALDAIRIQVKKSLPKNDQRLITYDRWVLLKNKEDLQPAEIEKRDMWFRHFPELEQAYWLKETMRDVYNLSQDRYEAFQRFYEWEKAIPDGFAEFKEIQKTFNNCKQEIFNYFIKPYTNAYTESVNNIIKSIEKAGKGYSFEVLRAKILYGTNATKKPKFDKKMNFHTFDHMLYGNYNERTGVEVEDRNSIIEGFGVDLLTLSNILEGKNE